MTQFRLLDQTRHIQRAKTIPRRLWKGVISRLDREGQAFRTGVTYENGQPVKTLTILRPRP